MLGKETHTHVDTTARGDTPTHLHGPLVAKPQSTNPPANNRRDTEHTGGLLIVRRVGVSRSPRNNVRRKLSQNARVASVQAVPRPHATLSTLELSNWRRRSRLRTPQFLRGSFLISAVGKNYPTATI